MIPQISLDVLKAYRAQTFRFSPAPQVKTPAEALDWVNERGFISFWPVKGMELPSLWGSVAGDRPVADAHDDPGHVTWGWKDSALGKKTWYYSKLLRKKATLVSLAIAPYFYALTENYGSPAEDYLLMYEEGRLTLAARQVYEALLKEGALNTIDLRRVAHLNNRQSDSEFNRALEVLQVDMKILPVGVAKAGAWKYAFIYDLASNHFPELPTLAREIGEGQAREKLVGLYFHSLGVARERDVQKIFGWGPGVTARVLARLSAEGGLLVRAGVEGQADEHLALDSLCAA